MEERRFRIQSHPGYGFYSGVAPDNRQLLLGLFCPNLIAFLFDADGILLRSEERPLSFFQGVKPPYDIFHEKILDSLEAWMDELGFRPSPITVRKFFSPQHGIGIEDYPSHFAEILNDPSPDEEEKRDVRESMELWDRDEQFVLLWGNDYWLDGSGIVVAS